MTHGVSLECCISISSKDGQHRKDGPITNSKAHRVPDQNHCNHSLTAQLPVRIDAIAHRHLNTDRVRDGNNAHGEYQSKPLHVVRSTDAPEDQTTRNKHQTRREHPQSVLWLHDAAIPPCHLDHEPVSYSSGVDGTDNDADEGRGVRESDHGCGEIVRFAAEDEGGGAVEDVEPDEVGAVGKAGVEDHGEG